MNIRQAILRAADSIEQNPHLFEFHQTQCPDDGCGMPGCALGWIGHHLILPLNNSGGYPQDFEGGLSVVGHAMGIEDGPCDRSADGVFYDRLDEVADGHWTIDASICAKTLRKYADVWHPAQRAERSLPESVLAIFEERIAA